MTHVQRARRSAPSLIATGLAGASILVLTSLTVTTAGAASRQPQLGARSAQIITVDGLKFRDLDHDGRLTPYEDWRLSPARRAADLLGRMTLEEKAGVMMHSNLPGQGNPLGLSTRGYDLTAARREIADLHINSFITRLAVSPTAMADQNNQVQALAEATRLGVPVTVSTDPRHHFQAVLGASLAGEGYSQWPEPLGFAALRDPAEIKTFAASARAEYRATGIQEALSPQADLLTEPRWSRGTGTFGSDPALAGRLTGAYVEGFQGGRNGPTPEGVMTVVKHWVGYGAAPEGFDGHNFYGRFSNLTDKSLKLHIRPFEDAFKVKVGGVMPTYNIVQGAGIDGKPIEAVGAGFNRQLLTGLLRGRYGYKGVVLSDWAITRDCPQACENPTSPQSPWTIGMPWGVERVAIKDRYVKAVNAGVDQFGGVNEPGVIVEAVKAGQIDSKRVDQSVLRILESKFQLGLFENPYVDVDQVARVVSDPSVKAAALSAQARSQVLLKADAAVLPAKPGAKVWLKGVAPAAVQAAGLVVVEDPAQADFALVRADTPHETLHPNAFFGARQNEGRLDFRPGDAAFDTVAALKGKTPVVLAVFLDRPAILTDILPLSEVVLANFGISDEALLAVVTGKAKAQGRMPFELPSSMAAVAGQDPALPDDTAAPLFPFGAPGPATHRPAR